MPLTLPYLRGTAAFGATKFSNGRITGVWGQAGTFWDSAVGTVECWVKAVSGSGGAIVAVGNNGTSANGMWLGISGGQPAGATPAGGFSPVGPTIAGTGTWHHLAITCDGTTNTLYCDGARVTTQAASGFGFQFGLGGSGTNAIGGFGANAGFDFPDPIDEVRISNVVRYSGATYTVPTAAFVDDANTTALYHLEADGLDSHAAPLTVLPTDSNLLFSPFNWHVNGTRAKTINPGAYFKFAAAASGPVTLNFEVASNASPGPVIKYRIDGEGWVSTPVAATVVIPLPAGNVDWTKHYVEVVVQSTYEFSNRWNPQNEYVSLTSIVAGGLVTIPIRRKKYNILIFGDSITEGYKSAKNNINPDGSDATVTWSYLISQFFEAEVGVVGFGAQGWTAPGVGGVPQFTTAYVDLWQGQSRVWNSPVPDAIIVNEGENGGAVQATVQAWITAMLALVPNTTKILMMRPFSGNGSAAISAAVTAIGGTQVSYVDTTGWWVSGDSSDGQHPWGYSSLSDLAPRLAAVLSTTLTPAQTVGFYRRDAAGAAIPVYTATGP